MTGRLGGEGLVVLSHMYPGVADPLSGIFIHRTVKAVAGVGRQVRVVAPVPWAPGVLRFNPRWKAYAAHPRREEFEGVEVTRPRYLTLPLAALRPLAGASMALSVEGAIRGAADGWGAILHAHCATPDGRAAARIGRRLRLPVACSVRGSDIHEYPFRSRASLRATRKALHSANIIIAVSGALRDQVLDIAGKNVRVEVVHNGVDPEVFRPSDDRGQLRRRWGIPHESQAISFVGRLEREKGLLELVEMYARIGLESPETTLILVGEGRDREGAEQRLRDAGVADRVRWYGRRTPREVAELLAASDLFCFPSHGEGLPNAVLEAMATGLPTVATRVGGVPEVIRDGEDGLLVDVGDVRGLIESVGRLLRSPALRAGMGVAARTRVERDFSWEANARHHERIYESLLRGARAR